MPKHDDDYHHSLPPPRLTAAVEQLVTVESQRELDLFSGERIERTFVKLYVEARRSGLLSTISDRDWKTLCTLATYMDADGFCFPSQAELAKAMGCSRQMANERVKSLASFRFQGQAVLLVVKGERSEQGMWSRNGYRVLPLSNLRIYDQPQADSGQPGASTNSTVSRKLDTVPSTEPTVSSRTVTVELDTKKNQYKQEKTLSNIRKVTTSEKSFQQDNAAERVEEAPARGNGVERIGHVLTRRRQVRKVVQQDEDYQTLQAYIGDFGREFNDQAPLKTSTTRAYNLFKRSGVSREVMIDQLYTARAIVKERTAGIRSRGADDAYGVATKNKAAYFFAVLEDLLGLRELPSGDAPPLNTKSKRG
jgi:hypothetical protein